MPLHIYFTHGLASFKASGIFVYSHIRVRRGKREEWQRGGVWVCALATAPRSEPRWTVSVQARRCSAWRFALALGLLVLRRWLVPLSALSPHQNAFIF
jgi:hypothetical protein